MGTLLDKLKDALGQKNLEQALKETNEWLEEHAVHELDESKISALIQHLQQLKTESTPDEQSARRALDEMVHSQLSTQENS